MRRAVDRRVPRVWCEQPARAKILRRVRRLAAVLAILNGEHEVSVGSLRAAIAFMHYEVESVDRIVSLYEARGAWAKRKALAGRLGAKLTRAPQLVRDVQRACGLNKDEMVEAIRHLTEECSPPLAVVGSHESVSGHGATRRTFPTIWAS
jgi:hypothetical protein